MKNKIIKILSKPKVVIPVFAIIAIMVIAFSFNRVGRSPSVSVTLDKEGNAISNSLNIINLSFPKSGRLEQVSVISGQTVHKGEVLAKLVSDDASGQVAAAKGSLELAEAQYASLNLQYKNAKEQQDLIVKNAYQTLLSSGLEGTPSVQDANIPIISGTYSCSKEGSYEVDPYSSGDGDTGISFDYKGLESGNASLKYNNAVALGNCGLQIKFNKITSFNPNTKWTINIPNTKSSVYLMNKNAYELALETRNKVLSELSKTIGSDNGDTSVAKAAVNAATGAYEAAMGAYANNIITAPYDGTISFVDKDLKVGQSIVANKNIISIITK